jgi:hypothetical protein
MGSKQIRVGQLISPFGPGSIYTDRRGTPLVVCGLDHWFMKSDMARGWVRCESRSEFERFEPRLADLLHVDRFCLPPDYRVSRFGTVPPPNAGLNVPSVRFPRWYRHSRTSALRRFNLNTQRVDSPAGGGRWLPVRFVSICSAGHLNEFPWKAWIGCNCPDDEHLVLTDRGGSELNAISVMCTSCPAGSAGRRGRNLSGTTTRPDPGEQGALQRAGIYCSGERPWLGEDARQQGCTEPLVGALINQTNLYFAKTVSAISLPDMQVHDDEVTRIRNEIEEDASVCGVAKTLWNMPNEQAAVALIDNALRTRGKEYAQEKIHQALTSLFTSSAAVVAGGARPSSAESDLLAFRRQEFDVIRNGINDPERAPNLVVISADLPASMTAWFSKLNIVERLRETRAFYGFDRLEPKGSPLLGMPTSAMTQLFRQPPASPSERWLPAIEVFGEGIYLELKEEALAEWQDREADWLRDRLNDSFVARLGAEPLALPPSSAADRSWASRYLLVHSFAHILINQLVFECGYSTASLRERLYVSSDPAAPMAGFLIYTAAGDSEGTLGGLVRLGQPDRIAKVIEKAVTRSAWCSADPVCSEHLGGQGSHMTNLAACHGCVLLPETSCETINHGLDRAMVVGEPADPARGYLSQIAGSVHYLE